MLLELILIAGIGYLGLKLYRIDQKVTKMEENAPYWKRRP